MTYQNVWWYPNYVEYGSGVSPPKTWPNVMEQYRKPDALFDLRYYDLPTENYESMLYYHYPRMGQPVYRGTFRDKPFCLPKYYPDQVPEGKAPGFHGRLYHEQGPPQFKYDGPKVNDLYWLERTPYVPQLPRSRPPYDRGNHVLDCIAKPTPPTTPKYASTLDNSFNRQYKTTSFSGLTGNSQQKPDYLKTTRKMSQSGVGYL